MLSRERISPARPLRGGRVGRPLARSAGPKAESGSYTRR